MQTEIAIAEPQHHQLEAALVDDLREEREANATGEDHERKGASAREAARMRRLEAGKKLVQLRAAWPQSGPKAKGWSEMLRRVGLDDSTAWRYMELAGYRRSPVPVPRDGTTGDEVGDPSHDEGDPVDNAPGVGGDEPTDPKLDQIVQSGPDRNTWCTPRVITEALGEVDLDPCANERSHVQARIAFRLDRGEDGLERAAGIGTSWLVFLNPPYGRGLVPPWVAAYKHTRFIFLLRFDPSTDWFHELYAATARILFLKERIEFEPPEGAESNSNPYPHALFFARADDVPAALLEQCFDCLTNHEGNTDR